ncbi:hypothetical protein BCR44DRAFT_1497559 [Catenaria anguillulae PL171]|uniref:P-loop containing nucleoside triphosphate hydrolase protein n=1 Tax=Catenaria anguillulae PL171 TaxID=765915 RepID=A0A1Y2HTP9_9FUNG|nr:hypothetical protein BCR44DRAFT_1497559 [Catenaria anguillulae PL171]
MSTAEGTHCPLAVPRAIWNPNGVGFSPCFLDFAIASALPAAVFLIAFVIALWCNRHSRFAYSLIANAPANVHAAAPLAINTRFGATLIGFTVLCVVAHGGSIAMLLDPAHNGGNTTGSLERGPLVAAGIRSLTWSLAALLAVYTVFRPNQPRFRGYIPWPSVLGVFFLASAVCSTMSFVVLHFHVTSLYDIVQLVAATLATFLAALYFGTALLIKDAAHPPAPSYNPAAPESDGPAPQLPASKEVTASLFSLAYFSWFSEIVALGSQKSLEMDDLWDLYPSDSAAASNLVYSQITQSRSNLSLVHALYLSVAHHLHLQISSDPNVVLGLAFVASLFLGTVLKSAMDNQTYFRGRRIGCRVRAILIGQVYAKALRARDTQVAVGKVMNMMQIDANKILEFSCYTHYFVTTPMQIVIAIAALYKLLGWASLAGVGVMFCVIPINAITGNRATLLQHRLMEATDKRTQVSTEIFSGIRTLKTFGWELNTLEWIRRVRTGELFHLRKYLDFTIALSLMWYIVPLAVTMGTFFCYAVLMGETLTATKVFTAISLFMALKFPLFVLPDMVIRMLEVRVSVNRIKDFLAEPEVARLPTTPEIRLNHASLAASSTPTASPTTPVPAPINKQVLTDISVSIPKGKLTLIIGKTLAMTEGTVSVPRSFAYVSQQAWLQNATIRDNILFGSSYHAARFNKLSGGQKQRLNLSRAAYSLHDTVIMDDILSALTRSLPNTSLNTACSDHVIVVEDGRIKAQGTPADVSQLGLLDELIREEEDHSVSLDSTTQGGTGIPIASASGSVRASREDGLGSLGALSSSVSVSLSKSLSKSFGGASASGYLQVGPEYRRKRQMSMQSMASVEEAGAAHMSALSNTDTSLVVGSYNGAGSGSLTMNGTSGSTSAAAASATASTPLLPAGSNPAAGRLVQEEDRARGSVQWRVYKAWITAAGGMGFWIALVIMLVMQQLGTVGQDLWLRHWTNAYAKASAGQVVDVWYYLGMYIVIGVCTISVIGLRLTLQFRGSMRASTVLHEKLLENLLYAKVRFFDTTPWVESVRFSRLPFHKSCSGYRRRPLQSRHIALHYHPDFVRGPLFTLFLIPIGFLCWSIGQYFLRCSRELKRLDSLTRSPIYSLFTETLSGVSVIRAYHHEDRFMADIFKRVDVNHRAFFYLWISNRWLNVRSDFIGALIVLTTGLVLLVARDWMDPALSGMLLSYALNVSDSLMWLIRVQAMVEMDMNSIERVDEWIEAIETEPRSGGLTERELPAGWPRSGAVQVDNLTVQYSATAGPVLKNVSFAIPPRAKMAAIDGVDIATVDLHTLRTALTMVPQDPVLFTGTVRTNLDIFSRYSDPELKDVLKRIHLGHLTLDEPVTENGANFSVGTRQMLSLGRALLRRPKVLILDEASSNLDGATDALITQTIREEFKDTTVITIAHRLQTIIDYDAVLVLDAGQVQEFGSPRELMNKSGGMFQKMCKESGQFEALLSATKK